MRAKLGTLLFLFSFIASAAHAGAWGYRSFENDDALDWVENNLKPEGMDAVKNAIATVTRHSGGYLQAPECSAAIAACEVLAAAQGKASPNLPKDVAAIAKSLSANVGDPIRKDACTALEKILSKSELRALWEESKEDFEKWKKTIEDLKSRV